MNVLLVAPSSGKWRKVGTRHLFNGRTFRFSLLSLLSVAADTPPGAAVRIVDEQIEDVPWDAQPDLVGITCMTALAPRAYDIARRFRQRGVPVVLGGMHPTLCPDEALRHADAIVVGDAEGAWQRVIADAQHARPAGVYRNPAPPSLAGLRPPPRHLLQKKNYGTVQAVQATRGCPHHCAFCAVSAFHGREQRRRPVDEVAAEVAAIPERFLIFVDDNLTADRDYCKLLFRKLTPLRKRWVTQSTLAIAEDTDFVKLAARAGCIGIFAGLETFSEDNLNAMDKDCHRVEQYRQAIRTLHAHGIGVEAGIVFGFDGDGPDVFSRTLRLLDSLQVDVVQASIFTPLPGTPQYEAMKDRLLVHDWAQYDFHQAVFRPHGMSPEALKAGHDWVTREFYRPWRILRRLARHACRPRGLSTMVYLAAVSLAYYGRVLQWNIRGWDPAARERRAHGLSGLEAIPALGR